jgi:hypothetical protein
MFTKIESKNTQSSGEYNFNTIKSQDNMEAGVVKDISIISCCTPAMYAIIVFSLALIVKKLSRKNGFTIQIKH